METLTSAALTAWLLSIAVVAVVLWFHHRRARDRCRGHGARR